MDDQKNFDAEFQPKRMNHSQRREVIMKAAMEIFHEKGYEGTSLNAIIERVGGSKRNFYTEFGGKEGLFKALLAEKMEKQIREQEIANEHMANFRQALLGAARRVVKNAMDPETLTLYRFMVQDGMRFPGVLNAFYDGMHRNVGHHLAGWLELAVEKGAATLPCSATAAANHFLSMLLGNMFFELLFNIRDSVTEEEIEENVVSIVDLFLNGIASSSERGLRE